MSSFNLRKSSAIMSSTTSCPLFSLVLLLGKQYKVSSPQERMPQPVGIVAIHKPPAHPNWSEEENVTAVWKWGSDSQLPEPQLQSLQIPLGVNCFSFSCCPLFSLYVSPSVSVICQYSTVCSKINYEIKIISVYFKSTCICWMNRRICPSTHSLYQKDLYPNF